MKQQTLLKTRRTFLKTGLLVTGTAAVGFGLNFTFRPDTHAIARQLTSYLQYHELAKKIGGSFINDEPGLQKLSLAQLTDQILKLAGIETENVTYYSFLNQLESFRNRVHEDFVNEDIVSVDGWVLSSTEAQLCALLYIYTNDIST